MRYGESGGAASFLKSPLLWGILGLALLGWLGFRFVKAAVSPQGSSSSTPVLQAQLAPSPSAIPTVAPSPTATPYQYAPQSSGNNLPTSGPADSLGISLATAGLGVPAGYYLLLRRRLRKASRNIFIAG